jgi:hypothetical protein
MATLTNSSIKMMLDLEKLNELNAKGYAGKFCLGDTVVLACGPWKDGPRWMHESEAVFDNSKGTYVERSCYAAANTTNATATG